MRRLFHPSMRKLTRWLNGEDLPLDRHLATCTYCADRLEAAYDGADPLLQAALLRLLVVPAELPTRLQVGIDRHLSNQEDLTLFTEFFGLPFRTARVITTTDQGDD